MCTHTYMDVMTYQKPTKWSKKDVQEKQVQNELFGNKLEHDPQFSEFWGYAITPQ